MTHFMRSMGSFVNAALFRYKGVWIDIVAIKYSSDSGDMHLIGKLTDPRLNLPDQTDRPIYLAMSLKACLYLPSTTGSSRGKPPSLWTPGNLKSSLRSV